MGVYTALEALFNMRGPDWRDGAGAHGVSITYG